MEAKYFGLAKVSDLPPVIRTAKGMGRIKKQLQSMTRGDFNQFIYSTGSTPYVRCQNTRRARGDQRFYASRVELWV